MSRPTSPHGTCRGPENPAKPAGRGSPPAANGLRRQSTADLHRHLPLDLLATLASAIRVEILGRLHEAPTDVKSLARELDLASDLVSYHLRQLRRQRLVSFESLKTRRLYALADGVEVGADARGTHLCIDREGGTRLFVQAPRRPLGWRG